MLHRPRPAARSAFLLLLLAGVPACSGGGSSSPPGPATLSGSLSLLGQATTVLEQEPNDTANQANALGSIVAGQHLTILGTIADDGTDELDAFLLEAPSAVSITGTLSFDPAHDFDFFVVDPLTLMTIHAFTSAEQPEVGTFVIEGPFILVVQSFVGTGSYSFELVASPPPALAAAGEGGHLGSLAPGSSREIAGAGSGAWTLSLPRGVELRARAEGAQVSLRDATADPRAPVVPALALESPAGEARARFGARSRVEVRVVGDGDWKLELEGLFLGAEPLPPAAPAPLALEAREYRRMPARLLGAPWPAVPGELLVQPIAGQPWRAQLAEEGAVEVGEIPGFAHVVRVPLPPDLEADEVLRATQAAGFALRARSGFADTALNYIHQAAQKVPNDPHYSLQWHYPQIHLPAAWEITTGSDDVIVAVLDTGSSDHPDLASRFIAGFDFISDPANAGDGDGIDPDPTDVGDGNGLTPSSFHGTHVAGTIGAVTDNGVGAAGVTWATRIMPLRVLGIQGGTDADIAQAVRFAVGLSNASGTVPPEPAHILNLSLGGPGSSQMMQSLYTEARAQGATIFAAAGNNNSSTPFFPAAYSGVISISAVDLSGGKAPYSNFHATVDLAAPGGNVGTDLNGDGYADGVLSTTMVDVPPPTVAAFSFQQGTSMACPHAAGVAALMLAVNPALGPTQIQMILESTATDLGAPGKDPIFGHGLINAHAAVQMAQGGVGGAPFLSLSTSSLNFSNDQTQLDVQIVNGGGGLLEVAAPLVSAPPNGTWLAATLGAATSSATNASSVRLTVNRAGLAAGSYLGNVTLDSNGGTKTIQVLMSVGTAAPPPDVVIFVLAVDATTFETRAQFVLNPAAGPLGYQLGGLPPGNYYLVAGSDDDDDGFICDAGDVWCGFYPTLTQPEIVAVGAGQAISSLDFPLISNFNSTLSTGSGSRGHAVLPFSR